MGLVTEPQYLGQMRWAWPEWQFSYDPERFYPFMAQHRDQRVCFLSTTLTGLEADLLSWDLG